MLQLLRWQRTTPAFCEAFGDGELLTMVRISAGRFRMGSHREEESGRDDVEGPVHGVELEEFLLEGSKSHATGIYRNAPSPASFNGDLSTVCPVFSARQVECA